MKIIKEGRNIERLRFFCHHCECIFEAEKGEYTGRPTYDERYTSYVELNICLCPNCKNEVIYKEL